MGSGLAHLVSTPKSFELGGHMGYQNAKLDETHRIMPKKCSFLVPDPWYPSGCTKKKFRGSFLVPDPWYPGVYIIPKSTFFAWNSIFDGTIFAWNFYYLPVIKRVKINCFACFIAFLCDNISWKTLQKVNKGKMNCFACFIAFLCDNISLTTRKRPNIGRILAWFFSSVHFWPGMIIPANGTIYTPETQFLEVNFIIFHLGRHFKRSWYRIIFARDSRKAQWTCKGESTCCISTGQANETKQN